MARLSTWRVLALLAVIGALGTAIALYFQANRPAVLSLFAPAAAGDEQAAANPDKDTPVETKLTPEQLAAAKEKLSAEQYNVCFLRGTEPPGSGKYEKVFDPGAYHCAVCGAELFKSDTKYDSHSGWPAFWDTAAPEVLEQLTDHDLGYARTEVRCKSCGAHLGHVFEDGPEPTGLRYCINSVALEFVPDGKP